VLRGPLDELAQRAGDIETRGEFVIVVAPPLASAMSQADVAAMLRAALDRHSVKDAVAQVTEASGRSRREVYALALELNKSPDEQ
jgi:16S rRNA (cytidine1402-2'-O)-methyltransferase